MKPIILLVLSCLALHNGNGAPTARYMYVRCNPKDGAANCMTYRGQEMTWSPDQPSQLPASSAAHLEAEFVEDEHPEKEVGEKEVNGEQLQPISDEGESPFYSEEYGSGFEGSAATGEYYADRSFVPATSETGSGERNMELYKDKKKTSWRLDEAKPEEEDLEKDHLLQV